MLVLPSYFLSLFVTLYLVCILVDLIAIFALKFLIADIGKSTNLWKMVTITRILRANRRSYHHVAQSKQDQQHLKWIGLDLYAGTARDNRQVGAVHRFAFFCYQRRATRKLPNEFFVRWKSFWFNGMLYWCTFFLGWLVFYLNTKFVVFFRFFTLA